MNLKHRMILNRVTTFIMGAVLTAVGILKNDSFLSIGLAMLIITVVQTIKTAAIISNPERYATYETSWNDERNLYIARKSYSMTFFASIYAEFAAFCVLEYLGKDDLGLMFACTICAQAVICWTANLFYRIKN